MYKKVSVVLGALALMVAIGFGASQSNAGGGKVCIVHNGTEQWVSASSVDAHLAHGDPANTLCIVE